MISSRGFERGKSTTSHHSAVIMSRAAHRTELHTWTVSCWIFPSVNSHCTVFIHSSFHTSFYTEFSGLPRYSYVCRTIAFGQEVTRVLLYIGTMRNTRTSACVCSSQSANHVADARRVKACRSRASVHVHVEHQSRENCNLCGVGWRACFRNC